MYQFTILDLNNQIPEIHSTETNCLRDSILKISENSLFNICDGSDGIYSKIWSESVVKRNIHSILNFYPTDKQ